MPRPSLISRNGRPRRAPRAAASRWAPFARCMGRRRRQADRHLVRRRAQAHHCRGQDRRRRRMAKGAGGRLHRLQPGRPLREALARSRHRPDPLHRRTHEISLVDLPCVPDATFEVVKDGVSKNALSRRAPRRPIPPSATTSTRTTMTATPTRASSRPGSVRKTLKRASPCPMAPIRSGPPRMSRTP